MFSNIETMAYILLVNRHKNSAQEEQFIGHLA